MQHPIQPPEFAVVIPAYNEEATIHDIATRALSYSSLVIVVDDGSTDHTITKLGSLKIALIKHEVNRGKAASLWDGIQAARQHNVKYIVTLDGDGQHAPEDIPTLLAKADAKPDHIIVGARLADKSIIPAKRYYANRIANFWIAWAAGYPISDSQSGFRVYPSHLFDDLNISISKRSSFVFESEILIMAAQRGIKCTSVPIPAIYAENARPSHFRGVRDITFITLMVTRSLFSRGLYLQGLYRSCIKPYMLSQQDSHHDYDGYLTLMLSIATITLSFGITFLLAFVYILFIAIKSNYSTNAHHIVILGKKLSNNLPDYDYRLRLNRALKIMALSPDKQFYILGGITGEAEISEALAGQLYLENNDIPAKIIHVEESSRNTLVNMKHLKMSSLITRKHIGLITNRYHLARASLMAQGFGLDVEKCAAEDSYTPGLIATFILIAEAFHLHWYLTGRTYAKLTRNQRMLARIQ